MKHMVLALLLFFAGVAGHANAQDGDEGGYVQASADAGEV